ncbi:hypothetical protein NECAME_12164, partial [Necator americanus]
GADSVVINCIVGENCVIGANCRLEESVIGNGVCIPDGTQLQKYSVISAEVSYPAGMDLPANCALCSCRPHEDFDETIKCKAIKGKLSFIFDFSDFSPPAMVIFGDVHIWTLASGGPFWTVNGRKADSGNGSVGDENEVDVGTESESGEPAELDATAQFYEEVAESMERIQGFTFSDQQMHNLILEINSSKLAYNISMEDVAKYVFSAFLALPGNETWKGLKELCSKWILLFKNYYKPKKSQVQLLLAIEERYKESPEEFGAMIARLVHFLYNDLDVLEEDAILEWTSSIDEMSFLNLVDFDGSIKRNKKQEAVLNTFNDRERFLRELEAQRKARAVDQKQQKAAIVVQRSWKAYKARTEIAEQLREEFDEIGRPTTKEALNLQMTRINVFYHHPDDDSRLVTLCSAALGLFRAHGEQSGLLSAQGKMVFYKCLLRYLSHAGKETNFVMPIRFLETFLEPRDSIHITKV